MADTRPPRTDRMIGGVCAAIANRFEMSAIRRPRPDGRRVVFFGLSIWLYLILWLLIPLDALS